MNDDYPLVAAVVLAAGTLLALADARRRALTTTPAASRPIVRVLRRLTIAAVFVSAATALLPLWVAAGLRGWPLLCHAAVGGVLSVALALFAIAGSAPLRGGDVAARASFVAMLLFALGSIGSMIASSFALFDTEQISELLAVHRWSGLGLAAATLLYAARRRRG